MQLIAIPSDSKYCSPNSIYCLCYNYCFSAYITVEPSIAETIGNQHFVSYSEVSLTQASSVFLVGMVLRNQTAEHNVAVYRDFLC